MSGGEINSASAPRASNSGLAPVLHSLDYSIEFLIEQIRDLTPDQMVTQPGGILNHPAWTIGHLTHVLELIGTVVGIAPTLSTDWTARYGPGSKPAADISVYENKDDGIRMLRSHKDTIVSVVRGLPDEVLDRPFPDPDYLDVFPTVRHALTQVLLGHTAFHVGQVSVWRRAMDLPALGRGYE